MGVCKSFFCHGMNKIYTCHKCKVHLCKACVIIITKKIWCIDCLIEFGLNKLDDFFEIQNNTPEVSSPDHNSTPVISKPLDLPLK